MRERMKKFFMAGIFLLFLIVLTIPAESQAAVRYNLIKDVTSQETPEGQLIDVAGKKRYLLNSGTYLKNQWISTNARIYHFNRYGYADTGWITYQGNKYFLRASGALHQGGLLWIKGRIYLFRYGYGHLITGWVTLRGEQYYFRETNNNGAMIKNWWVDEKCLGPDGKMRKNAWVGQYYVGEDGVRVKDAWVDDCYLGSNGKKVTNSWVGDYYVGEDGKKLTNTWQDGYYLDEEGKITRNAWVGDTYLGEDGLPATPPDSDVSNEVKRIFVGDSRTVGLYQIMTEDTLVKADSTQSALNQLAKGRTDIYIGKVGMGYDWLAASAVEELKTVLMRYPKSKVVLRMGINDLGNISAYIALYKKLMNQYPNASFYTESVTPVDETLGRQNGYSVTNKQILQFNVRLKAAFPQNYISSYNYVVKKKGKTVDGIHYMPDTYRMIYRFLDSVV